MNNAATDSPDCDMRLEVENLLLPHIAEAGHDSAHDNDDSHTQNNADHRDQGDHGGDRTFRLEVFKC